MMRGVLSVTVLTCLVQPVIASADGLEHAFRDRCLTPLESVLLPETAGLTQSPDLPGWWTSGDPALAYDLGDGAHLVITTGQPLICAVGAGQSAPDATQTFAQWQRNLNPDTPYIRLNATTWESFEWREPRLQVGLGRDGKGAGTFVYVHETDLEA